MDSKSAIHRAADKGGIDSDAPFERVYASFDEMPLHMMLLRGIYSFGFEKPSPIQQRAIVPIARGDDVIAQAQSGTGKTGAFAIGLLQRVDCRRRVPQAIVLSPTRELAAQTHEVVSELGAYLADGKGVSQLFVGRTRVQDDVERLKRGVVVAVGTPGRVEQLIGSGSLRVDMLRIAVLDEADEMLSQGFAEQVHAIFRFFPRDIQLVLVSATMPPGVLSLSEKLMRPGCTQILVDAADLTLEGLKQFYVAVPAEDKLATLMDLYESISIAQSVVFANTRRGVDWLSQELNAQNYAVSSLHAEMQDQDRRRVMSTFRGGVTRVLVTTDLVARGIDVHHVNVVVNFDVPVSPDVYLHRIGRSARYARKGIAINFVSAREVPLLKAIEDHYSICIPELPMDFAGHLGSE